MYYLIIFSATKKIARVVMIFSIWILSTGALRRLVPQLLPPECQRQGRVARDHLTLWSRSRISWYVMFARYLRSLNSKRRAGAGNAIVSSGTQALRIEQFLFMPGSLKIIKKFIRSERPRRIAGVIVLAGKWTATLPTPPLIPSGFTSFTRTHYGCN